MILRSQTGHVLVLSINNPGVRNALTPEIYQAIPAALAEAQANPELGAVVLTGVGTTFCAGGDLNRLALRRTLSLQERRAAIEPLHNLVRAIGDCRLPVIAAVEGAAAGAGLSLALACDMLVAARDAFFSVAYVKVGLSPDGGATAFLSNFVSRQILTELCLTGERVSAVDLHAMGAVNRLAQNGTALTQAIDLAERLACGPQRANARIKRLCRHVSDSVLEAQLDMEADLMAESLGDRESEEGISAFLSKRSADYK